MDIEITVPGLLAEYTGGRRRFALQAETLEEALGRLLEQHPRLAPHLYDESRRLRPHVLMFFNDENLARMPNRGVALKPGDRLQILQAVSGG